MMMPNWSIHYQTQWIEEKWDLTLQMIWYYRMPNHPVWLIEVEVDLFITPFTQLYQSTRMMMPLHCHSNHWNNTDQTQWIEEKWDLTSRMIRYYGMLHYPVWLIEVEEDLFLNSFIQLYQSTRMMMLHPPIFFANHHIYHQNTHYQKQWIEGKWDLTLQMIRYNGMHHPQVWPIEVEEDLFLTSFIQPYQSTRMMMPNWNNPDQSQWIQEKWDLTSRMTLPLGMHYHPVWLIEVEEDLFFSSLIQQYQSRRMMARHLSNFFYYVHSNHRNNHFQSQWIEE